MPRFNLLVHIFCIELDVICILHLCYCFVLTYHVLMNCCLLLNEQLFCQILARIKFLYYYCMDPSDNWRWHVADSDLC